MVREFPDSIFSVLSVSSTSRLKTEQIRESACMRPTEHSPRNASSCVLRIRVCCQRQGEFCRRKTGIYKKNNPVSSSSAASSYSRPLLPPLPYPLPTSHSCIPHSRTPRPPKSCTHPPHPHHSGSLAELIVLLTLFVCEKIYPPPSKIF